MANLKEKETRFRGFQFVSSVADGDFRVALKKNRFSNCDVCQKKTKFKYRFSFARLVKANEFRDTRADKSNDE